jgi:hypothetical protein
MNLRRTVLAAAALAALAWAAPARAGTTVGLGADYLVDPREASFQLTLAADAPLVPYVTLGGRFGVLLLTDPGRVGVPLDLRLRLLAGPLYLEGLIGPWIVLDDSDDVRFHAAGGVGLRGGAYSLGVEIGVLHRTSMLGVRLAFPL